MRRSSRRLAAAAATTASESSTAPAASNVAGLFALLSQDQVECILRCLTVDEMVLASWVGRGMRQSVHQLARQPAYGDAFWSAHWQTWHEAAKTTQREIAFMISMDPSRLPPWSNAWRYCEPGWTNHAHLLHTDAREGDDDEEEGCSARGGQYRADRSWPRLTAEGGIEACMAELGRKEQRYSTLAAFRLDYDDALKTRPDASCAVDPPKHVPINGDTFSCELVMKLNGDGSGRMRGWPQRSLYYDKNQAADGTWEGEGYQGMDYFDGAVTIARAGREAFFTVDTEVHDENHAWSPQPCLVRVRLVAPGQSFMVDHTIDAHPHGKVKITSQAGDLELCFHGSLGNYCHIMRRIPAGAVCPDPLVGECGCVMDDNPAGKWWKGNANSGSSDLNHYINRWYKHYNEEGEEDEEDESDE